MDIKHSQGTINEYAGIKLRSKVERTWAMHFDALGIAWEFEPFTFRSGGARYTPDFYLPDLTVFVEVKSAGDYRMGNRWASLVYHYSKLTKPFSGRPLIYCMGTSLVPQAKKKEYIFVHPPRFSFLSIPGLVNQPYTRTAVASFLDAISMVSEL